MSTGEALFTVIFTNVTPNVDPSKQDDFTCANRSGYLFYWDFGVAYSQDGLPVRLIQSDAEERTIAIVNCLVGVFGLGLNFFCARTIFRNSHISKAVKCYLYFDCYCRCNEAWTQFYKAYCILNWECVNPNGYLISGLSINRLVISFDLGMHYSMQMLGNGLCLNRIFAVFFMGLFYSKMETIALTHSLILWAIPIAIYCYQIGNLVNPKTGFVCYGGWYYAPSEYFNTNNFAWNDTAAFLTLHFDKIMYGVLGITMFLDVLVLWKVRQLRRFSVSKRRADIRLSILLVTTHLITICYFIGNYIVNYVYTSERPIFYYLVLEISPFLVHCILCAVVIIFNVEYKRNGGPSKHSSNTRVH